MKNRKIALILCVVLICSLLAGCMKNSEAVNFAGDIELGEDGIVTKTVLEGLRDAGDIASFCGKTGQYEYKWTVAGADIKTPADVCMAVSIAAGDGEELTVTLKGGKSFGFEPTIAVTLPEKWSAQSVSVYDENGKRLGDVSVTGSKTTVLGFKITDGVFKYILRADETEPAPAESAAPGISDGSRTEQDKYGTDPVPAGKPEPVEPESKPVDTQKQLRCTISIDCATILNNLNSLDPAKLDVLPPDGVILSAVTVTFYEGETVFDVLKRTCREKGIHLEASFTPAYNSAYIEGIGNLYEFDCGKLSGWMYSVNGWYPNYGCSRYALHDGDVIRWRYTCDLGEDVGGGMSR